jgi:hypothetical protein
MSGAVNGVVCFELIRKGDDTVLKLEHDAVGQISEKSQAGFSYGWNDLAGRLKALVEEGKKMGVRAAQ